MSEHRCWGSDHLLKVAAAKGSNWADIWAQSPIRATRNPNILFKGPRLRGEDGADRLTIPDRSTPGQNPVRRPTDQISTHRVSFPTFFLRLRILKRDFTPVAGARYSFQAEGGRSPAHSGTTDAHGHIEIANRVGANEVLPPTIQVAHLTVWAPADATGPAPSGYSHALRGDVPCTWELRIGALNPICVNDAGTNCLSGIQQRLNNLGFECGEITGTMNPQTHASVIEFQRAFGLTVRTPTPPDWEALQQALRDVHDGTTPTRSASRAPVREPRPENGPSSRVGDVALDFDPADPRSTRAGHFNSLVLRPQYRVSLRLGEIERLFPDPPDSEIGRAARMQVLGLFYFPLSHPFMDPAYRASHPNTTNPFEKCWRWFKEKILGIPANDPLGDMNADLAIQRALHARVIHQGSIRPQWTQGSTRGLPSAAENLQSPHPVRSFGKIRLPGGYAMMGRPGMHSPNRSRRYAALSDLDERTFRQSGAEFLSSMDFTVGDIHSVERCYFEEEDGRITPGDRRNTALGKIPLVALVERWNPRSEEWERSRDVVVYFQLVPPYELPRPSRGVRNINAPLPRERRTRDYIERQVLGGPATDPNDPQRWNTPVHLGGKRGRSVPNSIFLCRPTPGFNAPHASEVRGPSEGLAEEPLYPTATAAVPIGNRHAHAVKASTNPRGEAGVIFTPSRCGGDRYRLRAYVDPANRSDCEVGVETGTLVVWRNIRISQIIRHRLGAPHPSLLQNAARVRSPAANVTMTAPDYYAFRRFGVSPTGEVVDLPVIDGIELEDRFQIAFCELEYDQHGSTDLAPADWVAAHQKAKVAGRGWGFDMNILIPDSLDGVPFTVSNADSHLPMVTPAIYNSVVGRSRFPSLVPPPAGAPLSGPIDECVRVTEARLLPGFMEHLSQGGALPGITLVTGTYGYTWPMLWHYSGIASGLSTPLRGSFIWESRRTYEAAHSSPTETATHEIGHLLFRQHAPSPLGERSTPGAEPSKHQSGKVCVMSYAPNDGEFCGKCLLALRGCDISSLTT